MKAVILYGPPGGGKGTQANLLSRLSGFVHFDTGQYIEELLLDPISEKDSILEREIVVVLCALSVANPSYILVLSYLNVRFVEACFEKEALISLKLSRKDLSNTRIVQNQYSLSSKKAITIFMRLMANRCLRWYLIRYVRILALSRKKINEY